MRNMLIAIEGHDGVGKGTQSVLLADRLRQEGLAQKLISFPRYETEWGKLIKEYLHGRFGNPATLDPYVVAPWYAADRLQSTSHILQWMQKEERIVIADRYSPSNFAHQGAKIKDERKRNDFYNWLWNYEHVILGAPVPFCIFLDVPSEASQEWKKHQRAANGEPLDGHEADHDYQVQVRLAYKWLARYNFSFSATISCCEGVHLLSKKEVHERIWEVVKSRLNLQQKDPSVEDKP